MRDTEERERYTLPHGEQRFPCPVPAWHVWETGLIMKREASPRRSGIPAPSASVPTRRDAQEPLPSSFPGSSFTDNPHLPRALC